VTGPGAKPDGIPDILVSNSASGDIGVLPGVGGGFFNDQFPLVIPLGDDRHTALDPVAIIAAGGGVVTVNSARTT
jgi:hypothetical protein